LALEDLEPHLDSAEAALRGTPFPTAGPYAPVPRSQAMAEAAAKLGAEHHLAPLTIAFGDTPGGPVSGGRANLHRRRRYTCRMVGECNLGCNYGAKESLDYTCL